MSPKDKRREIVNDNSTIIRYITDTGRTLPKTNVIKFSDLTAKECEINPIMGNTSVELRDLKTDECAMLFHRQRTAPSDADSDADADADSDADADADSDSDSDKNPTIAIHNFASRFHCGGGYLNGAIAQEEDLCRVIPELYPSMNKTHYPHGETTCWITPNVLIMRRSDNYNLLKKDEQVPVVVVSAAAPALSYNREKWDEERVRNTLINIFVSVKKNNPKIDTLILGAFGCGAYGNDPQQMACLMNDVIQEYGGLYKRIVVSIPHGRDGNYDAFAKYIDYFE